jgi:hypothetical protein
LGALIDVTVAPGDASAFFAELRRRQVDYLVMADDLEEYGFDIMDSIPTFFLQTNPEGKSCG